VTKDQDLGFALARIAIGGDPEHRSKDEVAEGEEHGRMIQSRWSAPERAFPTPSGFAAPGSTTAGYYSGQGQAFWMWTLDHIPEGDHSIQIYGRVIGSQLPSADLNDCALTLLVSPTIE